MKYGYKETRTIDACDIRKLCIEKNWFTEGTNEEYSELLNYGAYPHKNITTDDLVEMATLILEHSEKEYISDYAITDIMWSLANICHTYFEEV